MEEIAQSPEKHAAEVERGFRESMWSCASNATSSRRAALMIQANLCRIIEQTYGPENPDALAAAEKLRHETMAELNRRSEKDELQEALNNDCIAWGEHPGLYDVPMELVD